MMRARAFQISSWSRGRFGGLVGCLLVSIIVLAQESPPPARDEGVQQNSPSDRPAPGASDPSLETQKGGPLPSGGSEGSALSTETKTTAPEQTMVPVESGLDYRYEPVGKRDPFRPYRDSKIGIGQIRASSHPSEPLERFDVKSLEVVAILWGNDKPRALIQDPDKQVHSVVKGQRIGKNEGFVAEIREGEVIIVELFDLNGKVVKESVVLPIKK